MKIAKDTVVSVSYELLDVNGGAILGKYHHIHHVHN